MTKSPEHEPRSDGQTHPDPDDWEAGPATVPSIGDYLAKQRQLRGISREELGILTRIPLRSLERLESGSFDALDDGFIRGFVRTVAEALGLDPDDTLARMSQEPESSEDSARAIAASGLMRVGMLAAGLLMVLLCIGVVRLAVQYLPGQDEPVPLVKRHDPVRALALAGGVSGFEVEQALVKPPPVAEAPEREVGDHGAIYVEAVER